MKRAVHSLAREALTAYPKGPRSSWILQWPSQLVLNCSQASLGWYLLHVHTVDTTASPTEREGSSFASVPFSQARCYRRAGVLDT